MALSAAWRVQVTIEQGEVRVRADGRVRQFAVGRDATAWLAGDVDAVRTRSGDWEPVLGPASLPIDPEDPAASVARLEGRFVLVVARRGSCWKIGRAHV